MSHLPKLVRDRIPEVVRSRGEWPVDHTATEYLEFDRRLRAKLIEEAQEVEGADGDGLVTEMADVMEVLITLAELHHVTMEEVEKVRVSKRKEYGGFDARTVLELILKEKKDEHS